MNCQDAACMINGVLWGRSTLGGAFKFHKNKIIFFWGNFYLRKYRPKLIFQRIQVFITTKIRKDSKCISASVSVLSVFVLLPKIHFRCDFFFFWVQYMFFSHCLLWPSPSPLPLIIRMLSCVSKHHVPIQFLSFIVILYNKKKLISTIFLKLCHGGYYLVMSSCQRILEIVFSPPFCIYEAIFFGTYNKRNVISRWIH